MTKAEKMIRKDLRLTEKLAERCEAFVKRNGFASFNEFIRYALMRTLNEDCHHGSGRKNEVSSSN